MGLQWSKWRSLGTASPYLDWWDATKREPFATDNADETASGRLVLQAARSTIEPKQSVLADSPERFRPLDDQVPIPDFAKNKDFEKHIEQTGDWLPAYDDLPGGTDADGNPILADDTIIVGVIDTGIPLGHNRFRNRDGTTRILAAWQQLAAWSEPDGLSQAYLPFGREVYQDDIDSMLAECSTSDGSDSRNHGNRQNLTGSLDEDRFNVVTGVLDMKHALGHREAAGRYSHGAHVLDAAAGADPEQASEFARRVKIIAVNIPSSNIFGESGTFLDQFMIYAVQRITDLSDAIWHKNHPEPLRNEDQNRRRGYKVVINISFGKQAGARAASFPWHWPYPLQKPRDGSLVDTWGKTAQNSAINPFPDALRRFRKYRENNNLAPVYFVMPVGNDNLLRCNAFLEPDPDETKQLNWRVLPEDQSSNYVEIWATPKPSTIGYPNGLDAIPLEIAVLPPGSDEASFISCVGQKNVTYVRKLGDYAAMYFQALPSGKGRSRTFRYVVCVAPTQLQTGEGATAPAGMWRIRVRNTGDETIQCVLSVQTDQKILPARSIYKRSYFDDIAYQVYDDDGLLVESYSYPAEEPVNLDLAAKTPVRRHGTMNASAAHNYVSRVGGYRVSDGKPAPYSATGRGRTSGEDDGTQLGSIDWEGRSGAPTASFPTDDGPAHFGVLSAGASNGSVVAMRGTSFASAQATRRVVQSLLTDPDDDVSEEERLLEIARKAEDRNSEAPNREIPPELLGKIGTENAGAGRIESPLSPRVSRTGR